MSKIPSHIQTGKMQAPEKQNFIGKIFGRLVEWATSEKPRTYEMELQDVSTFSAKGKSNEGKSAIEQSETGKIARESGTSLVAVEKEFNSNIQSLSERTSQNKEIIKQETIGLLGTLSKTYTEYKELLILCIQRTVEAIADSIGAANYQSFFGVYASLSAGIDTLKAHAGLSAAYQILTEEPNTGSNKQDLLQHLKSLETYILIFYITMSDEEVIPHLPYIKNIANLLTNEKIMEIANKEKTDQADIKVLEQVLHNLLWIQQSTYYGTLIRNNEPDLHNRIDQMRDNLVDKLYH